MRHSLELLGALITKDFKVRYKHTALGFVWSVANPVLYGLIFYLVFESFFRRGASGSANYFVYLLAGLFPWQCTANALTTAPRVFFANAGLLKKVYFPRILLPVADLSNNVVHFLLVIAAALLILPIVGIGPSVAWIWGLPLLLVLQCAITLGMGLGLAALNVHFRDLEILSPIFVQILFFLTPIIYPLDMLPSGAQAALAWNPMAHVISQWRSLMLEGTLNWGSIGLAAATGALVLGAGYGVYRLTEPRVAEFI
jgi:lipopolysaccharide transport system permease protein